MLFTTWIIGIVAVAPLFTSSNDECFCRAFQTPTIRYQRPTVSSNRKLALRPFYSTTAASEDAVVALDPQVVASGYSSKENLLEAIQDATNLALSALPTPDANSKIDLAVVSVSSVYDGKYTPSVVVPSVVSAASVYGAGIQHLIGSTVGGIISSSANLNTGKQTIQEEEDDENSASSASSCLPVEIEGGLGVSVMLFLLPDVEVKTFHVEDDGVPDDFGRLPPGFWKRAVGLTDFPAAQARDDEEGKEDDTKPVFMLIPSPGFQNDLEELLSGLQFTFPSSKTFGAIASTVSSLSRARLFRYDASDLQVPQTLPSGCVGVGLSGDIEARTMLAQGAKPVGGIYQILKGQDSTINTIVLDEAATSLEQEALELEEEEAEEENDDEEEPTDSRSMAAADYAKARIPKPTLAEANFVMRTLSDDDQSFMRKALIIGLERGGSLGRSPSELARLSEGHGHRFAVHQVARGGMKDGSVTFPLGSVDIQPGTRMRFFVRESEFAKKEVEALWVGYKKKTLTDQLEGAKKSFTPTGCFVLPTLDRGSKFFLGKPGFESGTVTDFIPTIPCTAGFFGNGVIMDLGNDEDNAQEIACTHGSASGYVLFGSKSGRPIYSPAAAEADRIEAEEEKAKQEAEKQAIAEEDEKRQLRTKSPIELDQRAPRTEDGELLLKRREVHSGRAISVSTVEWSVAEKTAKPTSALEGFMWDKETEVDRFRERVPLANLVSQCRLSAADPTKPKPRDWVGPLKQRVAEYGFAIIPECKRMEPTTGSLRKRYDVAKLARQYTLDGAPVICVNCDQVLFGGSLEDVTKAREAASSAAIEEISLDDDGVVAPPILASDLLLYPYQLYKQRLAGADAVNLIVGALESKDMLYLTKIASSLQLQSLMTVTTEVQLRNIAALSSGSIDGVIVSNRILEDFSFDMTGQQAIDLLKSDALKEVQAKHGEDMPVLVEGRLGIIQRYDEAEGTETSSGYMKELADAGARYFIVGGGLAESDYPTVLESLQQVAS